jgi:hypothetical protein
MAKNKISEFSTTAANNTDIAGIDIAEGCAPSGINNAIRELMAQIKDQQTGSDADNFTVGGNLAVTGTTTATGAITATGGVVGNVTGNVTGNATTATTATTATNVSGIIAILNGGTGATTAANAFTALKQNATDIATGVVELATNAEAAAGTDTTRAITPAGLFAGLNATGAAPIYGCRAWVNFNGIGAIAIRGSGNVSSITDNGVGDYTVNFSTAMQDVNYAKNASISSNGTTTATWLSMLDCTGAGVEVAPTTTASRFTTFQIGSGVVDPKYVYFSVFR